MVSLRKVFREQTQTEDREHIRILVPVSGSVGDERLLSYVARIAGKKNIDIALIYVLEVDQELPLDAELPAEVIQGESVLQSARDILRAAIDIRSSAVSTDLLQARQAGAAIVDEAIQDESDVIIMAASVRKQLGKITCGETIDYVLRNAPCEVVILRSAMPENILHELELDYQ